MNLIKRVKTQEEKDKLIAEAKKLWDSIPGEISHLVAASEDDYLQGVSNLIEVEKVPFIEPRPATAAELAKQNGELMFSQMFGDRADDKYSSIPAFAEMQKAQEQRDLEKLLGPGRRAESALESIVRSIVVKAIENPSAPRRVLGIVERMAIWSAGEDSDSDAAKFIRAYAANDTAAQREIARSLAAA